MEAGRSVKGRGQVVLDHPQVALGLGDLDLVLACQAPEPVVSAAESGPHPEAADLEAAGPELALAAQDPAQQVQRDLWLDQESLEPREPVLGVAEAARGLARVLAPEPAVGAEPAPAREAAVPASVPFLAWWPV